MIGFREWLRRRWVAAVMFLAVFQVAIVRKHDQELPQSERFGRCSSAKARFAYLGAVTHAIKWLGGWRKVREVA